jgi:hypothetical protein
MGIRIGFFVVVLLIALSIWAYDRWEKKRRVKKPTVDELIENIIIHIKPFENKVVKNGMGLNGGNLIINIIIQNLEFNDWNKLSEKDKSDMIRILNAL